jgi:hypothetical protein
MLSASMQIPFLSKKRTFTVTLLNNSIVIIFTSIAVIIDTFARSTGCIEKTMLYIDCRNKIWNESYSESSSISVSEYMPLEVSMDICE